MKSSTHNTLSVKLNGINDPCVANKHDVSFIIQCRTCSRKMTCAARDDEPLTLQPLQHLTQKDLERRVLAEKNCLNTQDSKDSMLKYDRGKENISPIPASERPNSRSPYS